MLLSISVTMHWPGRVDTDTLRLARLAICCITIVDVQMKEIVLRFHCHALNLLDDQSATFAKA
jgi:hypothetical protein